MKYIRTKNGIYNLDKGILYEFTGRKVKMPYCEEYERQPELCKTADTIKELCDAFVCIGNGEYQRYIKYSLKEALQKKEWLKRLGYTCNIYGAIWTDKGLIYIAKMKEDKELELL